MITGAVSARTGWDWIKRGFGLFRKQPAELATLLFAYLFLLLAASLVPVIGTIFPIFMPLFSMAFMQAARQVEAGQRVYPTILVYGFRSPMLKRLLALGALNLLAALLALSVSALADDGMLVRLMANEEAVDENTTRAAIPGMLAAAAIYVPVMMAFWYAAPLIAWQRLGMGKALFFSFFAVKRAGRAFLVYGLAWSLIVTLVPAGVNLLLMLITGSALFTAMVTMPLLVLLMLVMLCSFYPMYTDIFGRPEELPAPAPLRP